jgi:hypothetical protein
VSQQSVGNLATILSIDATSMSAGLAEAARSANSFASQLQSAFSVAIPALSASAFKQFIESGVTQMNATRKSAEALGVTLKQAASYEYLAGNAGEGFTHAVEHLNRHLGEVRMGSEEARKSIQALGIDAEKLANMDPHQALRSVMEHIKGIGNQSERTATAVGLMGREAADMMNIFQRGAAALDDAEKATERFYEGLYGPEAAAKLKEFTKASKEAGAATEGLTLRAKAAAAPWYADTLRSLTDLIENPATRIGEAFGDIFAPERDEFGNQVSRWRRRLQEFEEMSSGGGLASPVANIAGERENPLIGQADKHIESLSRELEALMGTKQAMDSYRMALAGVTSGRIEEIEFLEKQIELYKFSKTLIEEMATPLERFNKELERINSATEAGVLDMDTALRKVAAMYDAADRMDQTHRFSPAASYGSREAYSTINQYQFGQGRENAAQRIERINQQMLDEQRRSRQRLDEMAESLRNKPVLGRAELQ